MERVELHVDMAEREWLQPNATIDAEADTTDVAVFYAPFSKTIRVARLNCDGKELVLFGAGDKPLPWATGFGAVIAAIGAASWDNAIQSGFEGISLVAVGKASVKLAL